MPLEPGASVMVVSTQAFAIGRKLTEDSARIEQEYLVDVDGELASDGLKRLNHGLSWQGVALPPIKVSWQSETRLRFALKNPWPGLIADMCRSEEHTSELQSLMRKSYAVFCLQKKKKHN